MTKRDGGGRARALPRFSVAAALVAVTLLACQAAGDAREPRGQPEDLSGGSDMERSASDSLSLTIEAPDRVVVGEPVPFTLRLENLSDRTLTLYLTGREIAFDVIVQRADGATVWRRLEGEVVQSILRLQMLEPEAALVLESSWDQRSNAGERVAPGEYRVRGEVLTEDQPIVSPAEPLRILVR